MLKASIDIGSNSILLLICEVSSAELKVLENHSHVTALGKNLDENKIFLQESMDESLSVLKQYSNIIEKYKISAPEVFATATEASRVAQNAEIFYNKVRNETGISVCIISSEAEAYYSTIGILADKNIVDKNIVIMDIGGASTELIKVQCAQQIIESSFSMPVGAVRMNNWRESGADKVNIAEIYKNFEEQIKNVKCDKLYCVAGTMTSVANMHLGNANFVENDVNGLELSALDVKKMLIDYEDYSVEDFMNKYPFLGKRSQTIKSGIHLASKLFEWLGVTSLYVSTYGLRYGTLLEGALKDEFIIKRF
jgi:exopolyphosphatase/guanosine-5'-triphosphate,3'-diphosphate pyrophosphatase